MTRRYYSSIAQETYLVTSVLSTDTSFLVGGISGFPSNFPYTIAIEPDTANEEICEVTASSGTTMTVTRGVDGSTAQSHTASGTATLIQHRVSARDFDEANLHVNSTADVHGVTGALASASSVTTALSTATTAATSASAALAVTSSLTSVWTAYTPTFSGITTPVASFAYKLTGKTLTIRGAFSSGTIQSPTSSITFSLPGVTSVAVLQVLAHDGNTVTGASSQVFAGVNPSATTGFVGLFNTAGSSVGGLAVSGTIEVV